MSRLIVLLRGARFVRLSILLTMLFAVAALGGGGLRSFAQTPTPTPAASSLWTPVCGAASAPSCGPQARDSASMAYDAAANSMVLFGGESCSSSTSCSVLGDTWTFNGSAWTKVCDSNGTPTCGPAAPAPKDGASMAYDAATRSVVLYGGLNCTVSNTSACGPFGSTFTFNGSVWSQVCVTTSTAACGPGYRFYASMAYDAAHSNIVLFGGVSCDSSGNCNDSSDTWAFNGSAWTAVCGTSSTPSCGPQARDTASMAYDAAHNNIVLFGGENCKSSGASCTALGDTWTFNGSTWTQQKLFSGPPALQGASMAYDAAARDVVMFGGTSCTASSTSTCGVFGDTASWNGSTWATVCDINTTPACGPTGRAYAGMDYDATHNNLVLFGGVACTSTTSTGSCSGASDTWILPGSAAAAPVSSATPTASPTATPTPGIPVTYAAGWNLAGGPSGTVLNGAAGSLFALRAGDTNYESFPANTGLSGGIGVWAYFPTATTVTLPLVSAPASGGLQIALPANQYIMAGNPFDGQATVSGADVVLSYNAAAGQYVQSTTLNPGQGAWVFSRNGGTLTIAPVGATASARSATTIAPETAAPAAALPGFLHRPRPTTILPDGWTCGNTGIDAPALSTSSVSGAPAPGCAGPAGR